MKDKERINASIALYNCMEKNIEYFTIKKSTKITHVSCSIEQIKTLLRNTSSVQNKERRDQKVCRTARGKYFLPASDRFPQFYRNAFKHIVAITSQVWLATGCVNACGSRSRRCVHLVIVDGALTPVKI